MKKLRELWELFLFHLRSLFGLVLIMVVLGFVGCASSLERNWGLKEEGTGYVSDMKTEKKDDGSAVYSVKIRYCRKESTVPVSWRTYDKLWLGKVVYLKLFAATYRNEEGNSGDGSCEVIYAWWATDGSFDRALLGKFSMPR